MQDNLIEQGLNLMLFGMGTVFVFLTILVFATTLMSKLVSRFFPAEQIIESELDSMPSNIATANLPKPQIMAAIEQAIAAHRQR